MPGVERIGEHSLVSRFMKGVFNLRPPQPRYSKMWDIGKVLLYLKGLGRNEDLTLQQLTLKITMPLSILAGRRLHTLHKLETSKMDIFDVGGKVIVTLKVSQNVQSPQELIDQLLSVHIPKTIFSVL